MSGTGVLHQTELNNQQARSSVTQKKTALLVLTQDLQVKKLIENFMVHNRLYATFADSAAVGAQFLKTQPLPDVLILDLTISHAEAIDFLRQMRRRAEFARLPVLVLTDVPDPDRVKEALAAGANRYLTKLFVGRNLLSTLEEMVR